LVTNAVGAARHQSYSPSAPERRGCGYNAERRRLTSEAAKLSRSGIDQLPRSQCSRVRRRLGETRP